MSKGETNPTGSEGGTRVVAHATCLGCGCVCDDIDISVRQNRIVEARNACTLGVDWFGNGSGPARVLVAGRETSTDAAVDAAARLLADAERLLVYLAPDISCETQRETIALADMIRAALDTVTSATALASILAAQEQGRAGATLGELRHRADVLVFWGVDPALRYPRFWTRYAPEPAGLAVPNGRRSRTVVAVDVGEWSGPADADLRLAVAIEDEVATLTASAALVSGAVRPDRADLAGRAWALARQLVPTLLRGRYVGLVADGESVASQGQRDPGRAAALTTLGQALNGPTRGALCTLRAGGNRSGADAGMTSQTGYPTAVDFARGYPAYRPYDGTASARLARGDVDALLVIGAAARIPDDLISAMARVPSVAVGPKASESALANGVAAFDTAVAGIHEGGTALRMDDVPLPLKRVMNGPPSAALLVRKLRDRVGRNRLRR